MTEPIDDNKKIIRAASIITTVMLLFAVLTTLIGASIPYGYYMFLRLVVTATAILLAIDAKGSWSVGWIFVALLFNPLIPVHLTREIWFVVDAIVAVGISIYNFIRR